MRGLLAAAYKNKAGVSAEERQKRQKDIEKRLFHLELKEEELICQAEGLGLSGIYRRMTTSQTTGTAIAPNNSFRQSQTVSQTRKSQSLAGFLLSGEDR